jgi:superfamily I DNA and/or RNA helicase
MNTAKINSWKNKLLDLSLNNTLLNVDVSKEIYPTIYGSLDLLENALASQHKFCIFPKPPELSEAVTEAGFDNKQLYSSLSKEDLNKTLSRLFRSSKLSIEENGVNTLYIALGLLKWLEPRESKPCFAPVLLLPVEISRKTTAKYEIQACLEDLVPNLTLLERLRQSDTGIVTEALDLLLADKGEINIKLVLQKLREAISDKDGWTVEEQAILGIFLFNKFILWNDIDKNADKMLENKFVLSLVTGKPEWEVKAMADALDLNNLNPEEILLPVAADSSQLEAIYEAVNGKSYILHGPPGTGKSQTITNIIANMLYRGKQVLFVSEKMAALSVVQKRLEKIGIAPFCLELHSNKTQKQLVSAQLEKAIHIEKAESPEDFWHAIERLSDLRAKQHEFGDAMHTKYPIGISLYEAVTRYLAIAGEQKIKFSRNLPRDMKELQEWQDAIDRFVSVSMANIGTHPNNHPLKLIRNPRCPKDADKMIEELLAKLSIIRAKAEGIPKILGIDDNYLVNRKQTIDILNLLITLCNPQKNSPPTERTINSLCLTIKNGDTDAARKLKSKLTERFAKGVDACWKIEYNLDFSNVINDFSALENTLILNLGIARNALYENHGTWIENATTNLLTIQNNWNKLRNWQLWLDECANLNKLSLNFVHVAYQEIPVATEALRKTFDKGIYQAIIQHITDTPYWKSFSGGQVYYDTIIEKYKKLIPKFEELTKKELYAKLFAYNESTQADKTVERELYILKTFIGSKKRNTSIRDLFSDISALLPRLCPCMLMSPVSVAQYLDINAYANRFDLVIFDEASQIPTCEAIGVIARGKNIIIAGDPKQLPPTDFFSATAVDEMADVVNKDMDNILDDYERLVSKELSKHLRWHYRSKHESLISFSNKHFYNNRLFTFPSSDNIQSKVSFSYTDVKGVYEDGMNKVEAQAVVDEIECRLSDKERQNQSIGVVTFNIKQRELIDNMLSELFIKQPHLEKFAYNEEEPLFIKNLENVQGDERDVILFSVGYGPNAEGKVSMTFGPLNTAGGERRLNVAVSRAKYEMKIFSSLQPNMIKTTSETGGVARLRDFLKYAKEEDKMAILNSNTQKRETIEDIVAEALRRESYEAHTHIGSSGYRIDLGIVDKNNPGQYVLGVLFDGENYRQAKTVRDREIVQHGVLRQLGWNICRVWTMDCYFNLQEVLDNLKKAIIYRNPS